MPVRSHDPGKESRSASGIPVVPVFDGYRAYAILGIVLLHVLGTSGVLDAVGTNWFFRLAEGTLGQLIDVLFIISGFVVFLPTVARRGGFGSVKAYALRRAARLVPAYWLILGVLLVLIALIPSASPPAPGATDVALHFGFLHTAANMFDRVPLGFGVDAPVWTLSLEVTFYAILPLVAGWYFRRPVIGLLIAAAVTAIWHEAVIHYGSVVDFLGVHPSPQNSFRLQTSALSQFPFFAFSFGAGMTAAWAYVTLRERLPQALLERRAVPAQIVAFVSLLLFAYLVGRKAVAGGVLLGGEVGRRSPLLALGYTASLTTLMLAIALGPRRLQRPFANPVVRWLGDVSYGIYLVHVVILVYVMTAIAGGGHRAPLQPLYGGSVGDFLLVAVVVFPASILYGYLSARLLEQPIRRWAHRFGRRGQDVAAPEPAAAGAAANT